MNVRDLHTRWTGPVSAGPIVSSAAALAVVLGAERPLRADTEPGSPVNLLASVNRSQFDATEWNVLLSGYDLIIGLSVNGYNFPGEIEAFRATNTTTPVLTYLELIGIQGGNIGDDRYDQYDVVEDVFFHTSDPASLRVFVSGGATTLTWARDSRDRSGGSYTAPGVAEYIVQEAPSETGPWTDATTLVPEPDEFFYRVTLPGAVQPARWYRVVSRLADDRVVDYSWPAQPDLSPTVIESGLLAGFTFTAVVSGPDAPAQASDLVLEVDLNANRWWGESFERVRASSRVSLGGGRWEYSGTAPWFVDRDNYRFVLDNIAGVTGPPNGESYTIHRRNNRLQTKFTSFIVKPAHPLTRSIQIQRVHDALAVGYSGVSCDFAYDDVTPSWITVANVVAREQAEIDDLPAGVDSLLAAMRAAEPGAIISVNGFFVTEHPENFYTYMNNATAGVFEFFGFGFQQPHGATEISGLSDAAIPGVIETSHVRDKISLAVSKELADNHVARLKSLAMYLLVVHDKAYYYYMATDHQTVDWYPEWRVPIGEPLIPVLSGESDIFHPVYYFFASREFTNGRVYFNWHDETPAQINLPTTMYRLELSGGSDPIVGGDGRMLFVPVEGSVTLEARDGLILLDEPPRKDVVNVGWQPGDQAGREVEVVGDLDGDGTADYAVGIPLSDEPEQDTGRVDVYSGRTGAPLFTALGREAGERFGESIAGLGDVDGDDVPDVLVGAPFNDHAAGNAGAVYVLSGADGSTIGARRGQAAGDRFGHAVAGGIDVDGDGVGDFIVGAPYADAPGNNAGKAYVYAGATRRRLATLRGARPGDRFGWTVEGIGRLQGGGANDFAVSAPFNDDAGAKAGKVYVYEGSDFDLLYALEGRTGEQFGRAVAGVGRVDGDNRDDIAVGSPYADPPAGDNAGRIELFSGRDGARLWNRAGTAAGARLGWSLAAAGDVDGDGSGDVAAGAPFDGANGPDSGHVVVRDGAGGSLITVVDGSPMGQRFGWSVAGGSDLDGTGAPDVLVGAPLDDLTVTDVGRVEFVPIVQSAAALAPVAAERCPADLDDDRTVGPLDLILALERRSTAEITTVLETWGPC